MVILADSTSCGPQSNQSSHAIPHIYYQSPKWISPLLVPDFTSLPDLQTHAPSLKRSNRKNVVPNMPSFTSSSQAAQPPAPQHQSDHHSVLSQSNLSATQSSILTLKHLKPYIPLTTTSLCANPSHALPISSKAFLFVHAYPGSSSALVQRYPLLECVCAGALLLPALGIVSTASSSSAPLEREPCGRLPLELARWAPEADVGIVGCVCCDCESAGLRRAAAGGEEVMWLSCWSVGAGWE